MTPTLTITRARFKSALEKKGLWRNNMSIQAYGELGMLIEKPFPLLPSRGASPCSLKRASVIISAGFARLNLDAKQYEATEEGRQWHAKVKKLFN